MTEPKWKPLDPEKLKKFQDLLQSGKMKVECAPQDKLRENGAICIDLVDNLLDYPGALITDLSLVSDFTGGDLEEEKEFIEAVQREYGVDISSMISEYIVDIAEFIKEECSKNG